MYLFLSRDWVENPGADNGTAVIQCEASTGSHARQDVKCRTPQLWPFITQAVHPAVQCVRGCNEHRNACPPLPSLDVAG